MGTSGSYGGSPGWEGVKHQTEEWLNTGAGAAGGGDEPAKRPTAGTEALPPILQPRWIAPALKGIISALGGALAIGGAGRAGGGLTGGGSRSTGRASTVGGRALGGAYGARTGNAASLDEIGLELGELAGLTRYQQAQRILDAAMGPRGDVLDSELRKANAEVVLWALTEEVEPTPLELTNRWVVEYVWEVWITEAGPILQAHSDGGKDRARSEEEMRAALEAIVSSHALPEGRPLTAADFAAAIEGALSSLRRVSGNAA